MKIIEEIISNTIQESLDGKINSLEVYSNIVYLQKYLEKCKEQIEEMALSESAKYPEKTIKLNGFEITKRNGSVTYDYSKDEHYNELNGKLLKYKQFLTDASKLGKTILDEKTGEIFQPCPVKSGSKDSLVIKKI